MLLHPAPASRPHPADEGLPPVLSVIVPVRNEGDNIRPLIQEIGAALQGVHHEIIYVDDGSTDGTPAQLQALRSELPGTLTLRRHRTSCGQSAAIVTGIRAARGLFIATLDGDGQNDPADIPALLAQAQAADDPWLLVAGHRTQRRDTWTKRHTSRIANRVRAGLLHDATPDTGCGLKLFRRAAFAELPCFDHMHRYLPALFIRAGGRVVSVPVNHRPRTRGRSNYGTLDRLWVGLFDLVGVAWLQRRWKRPEVEQP
jgi:dolichol-phosphate mannosyltransferase